MVQEQTSAKETAVKDQPETTGKPAASNDPDSSVADAVSLIRSAFDTSAVTVFAAAWVQKYDVADEKERAQMDSVSEEERKRSLIHCTNSSSRYRRCEG
jgi:hypothetical protein